jgi:NDP-sugar pyrophosphorylase family protein
MRDVDVILDSHNEIKFYNTLIVEDVTVEQMIEIKNQIIGTTVLKHATKLGFRDTMILEYDKIQSKEGIGEVQQAITTLENELKQYVNINQICEIKERIRSSFNLGTSFIVQNDRLVRGSAVRNINIKQINKAYNETLQKTFTNMLSEYQSEQTLKPKIKEQIEDLGLGNSGMLWGVAGIIGAGALFLYMYKKKPEK